MSIPLEDRRGMRGSATETMVLLMLIWDVQVIHSSICPSNCPSIHQSVHPSVCPSVHLFICPSSICPSVHHPSVRQSICPFLSADALQPNIIICYINYMLHFAPPYTDFGPLTTGLSLTLVNPCNTHRLTFLSMPFKKL